MRIRIALFAVALCLNFARADDGWRQIHLVDRPEIRVSLIHLREATPADERFIGFEFENRTDRPLRVINAHYRIEDLTVRPRAWRADEGPVRTPVAEGGPSAIELARRGIEVTGVDLSPDMLREAERAARQAGVSVRWIEQDAITRSASPSSSTRRSACARGPSACWAMATT